MELHGRKIDLNSLEFAPIDFRNENVHIESATYTNGRVLSDTELNELADRFAAELHALYMAHIF